MEHLVWQVYLEEFCPRPPPPLTLSKAPLTCRKPLRTSFLFSNAFSIVRAFPTKLSEHEFSSRNPDCELGRINFFSNHHRNIHFIRRSKILQRHVVNEISLTLNPFVSLLKKTQEFFHEDQRHTFHL